MTESKCAICTVRIAEENNSLEHVIQNFLGGRLEVEGFLCRDCNSTTGHTWDSDLAKQLSDLALFVGVVRARGKSPARTVTSSAGENVRVNSDGTLALDRARYKIVDTPNGPQLSVTAPDERSARELLEGLKRKRYPKIDVEVALKQAVSQRTYMSGAVAVRSQIGGESEGRAIVKSVAAFAHACGIPFEACEQAAQYLRSQSGNPCFGYYWTKDLVAARPHGVPLQCVAIKGDPDAGLLLGYAEYFGYLRIVACLSMNYTGEAIERSYAIDPTTGEGLDLSVSLDFSRQDIEDIYAYKHVDNSVVLRDAGAVIGGS